MDNPGGSPAAAVFIEETLENLAYMEQALLELETHPADGENINRVFRTMHTIKGSGWMFGFEQIAEFAHDLETALVQVRDGRVGVSGEMVSVLLRATDLMGNILQGDASFAADDAEAAAELVNALFALCGFGEKGAKAEKKEAAPAPKNRFRITFFPGRDAFVNQFDILMTLLELEGMGEAVCRLDATEVPPLGALDPTACQLRWEIELTTECGEEQVGDIFLFLEPDAVVEVERLEAVGQALEPDPAATEEDAPHGEEQGAAEPARDGGEEELHPARERQKARTTSVRVGSERLDKMVNMVGELVILQARLTRHSLELADAPLELLCEELERLTAEMRDSALGMRMAPIGTTFGKYRRLVRNLAEELGKDIRLETVGAETELDKTVIEKLGDPLMHLIRNCADHGIEPPMAREEAGKPRQGTVRLEAIHAGGEVRIRVSDDGKGLDVALIRAKAQERGLIGEDEDPDDDAVLQYLFTPGFSTAERVSEVSGRGIGLDVVKRYFESLGGQVHIAGKRGEGTATTLRLPLTLAIIEGLLVHVGEENFVVPLRIIEECLDLSRADRAAMHDNQMISVRGELVPYMNLRAYFGVTGNRPEVEQVVITNLEGERFGIAVDQVAGQFQAVIKSLGAVYRDIRGLSGATILGDGSVALILDAPTLMKEQLQPRGRH